MILKRVYLVKFLLSIVCLSNLLFAACKSRNAAIQPQLQNITTAVYASGKIKSNTQYQVYASVNGLVQKIFVAKGDTVHKGDKVLQLQNTAVPIYIDNARLNVMNTAVQANLNKLEELRSDIQSLKNKYQNDSIMYLRQQNLWRSGIGTRNELDQKELQYNNDRMAYDAANFRYSDLERQIRFAADQSQNNLRATKATAEDYIVKSDVNGKIFDIFIKEGEMVTPQTALAFIGGDKDFIVELQVDEYDIVKLRIGQKIIFTMDSYKNKVFEAAIEKIIPLMNERTRSFTVEGALTNAPDILYPNLTVDANIITGLKKNVLTIPRDYLASDTTVLLQNGKKQRVLTGLSDYSRTEIVSGLSKDDKIVKPIQ